MKKTGLMKKITLATGIAVAVASGVSLNAGSAWATYLGTPSVSLTNNGDPTTFAATVTNTSDVNTTVYVTPNSTYGDTIPTAAALNAAGVPGTITTISGPGVNNAGSTSTVFYNPNTGTSSGGSLNLSLVNTMTTPYTGSAANGDTFTGYVQSNVLRVGAGSGTGDLVFTYQFDVTGVTPPGSGINGASVSFFNEPLNLTSGIGQSYVLGTGINGSLTNPYAYAVDSTLSGTPINFSGLSSSISYDPVDGTIYSGTYSSTSDITAGNLSPQFFVASNALNYGLGSITFGGSGAGLSGVPVFVPDTPEPSTLVLLGTGLGLLAFMTFRKRLNQSAI